MNARWRLSPPLTPRGPDEPSLLLLALDGVDKDLLGPVSCRCWLHCYWHFAGLYHSWHGSPSRKDSELPFILAHPRRSRTELAERTRTSMGNARQQDVTPLLLELLAPL